MPLAINVPIRVISPPALSRYQCVKLNISDAAPAI